MHIRLEKEIEKKLTDFIGKVKHELLKILEESFYNKLAQLVDQLNQKLKDHVLPGEHSSHTVNSRSPINQRLSRVCTDTIITYQRYHLSFLQLLAFIV